MRFTLAPTIDEYMDELAGLGWSVGDTAANDGQWIVCGTKSRKEICSSDTNRTEAWRKATEQARVVGMVKVGRN
ncbi:MAG: hypothetical protein U0796_15020 [Gemmatales bacterium]